MRRRAVVFRSGLFCSGVMLALTIGLPSVVAAGEPEAPDTITAEPLEPHIYGGSQSSTCGWPTTVLVTGGGGLCTGTLIHPQLVITAAHCIDNNGGGKQINFGPSGNSLSRNANCYAHPSYNGNSAANDIAYCPLTQAVNDVPIIPPLFGCEVAEYITPGQQVEIVGYGETNQGNAGVKYEVTTTITGSQGGEVFIGGNGLDSCSGDSGGPVYVRLDDGSWRVFGITSYGGQCGSGGVYGNMATNLGWVEQQSGIDVSPCHDSQGNWTPNPNCGGFPTDPSSGAGTTWSQQCGGGPVSGFSATCGAPFSSEADDQPPSVTITSPADGSTYESGAGGLAPVTINANASDNAGVQSVRLLIDGDQVATDDVAPYTWDLEFPAGSWTIEAVAIDYSQNQTTSNPVTIGVDQDPEPDPDTGDSDSGNDSDSGDSDSGDSDSGEGEDDDSGGTEGDDEGGLPPWFGLEDDPDGCACAADNQRSGGPSGSIVGLFGLLMWRLSRRRAAQPAHDRRSSRPR